MNIIHWNISKVSHPMYALRKYEDELFCHIKELKQDWNIERIWRKDKKILGSTVFSWLFYKSNDADVVHATSQTVAPAAYFKLKKSNKFIVTVHDLAPLVYPSEITDVSMRIQWMLTPKALRKADRIIAISEFTKEELMGLIEISEEKISVIHQGVDHEKYKPLDKIKCKEKFGLNQEDKHILVVSSNVKHKRMDLAKNIFDHIRSIKGNIKMIKAGYGEVLKGEGIISVGWVKEEEMPLLFNAADVYLHTSEYEGFGLPVLEAMACGVPVVANNKASIPEIVGDCGSFAGLDENNIIQTSEKILSLIDNGIDREAMEQSKKFSWKKTAEETIEVYEDVYKGE
ncbi:D-inositol-3-phosphate glycosyltransferase [Candidatus Methanoperedenaceae archaeon GB37]|nr:D-inositol-3-phosphate glycosyltransferase [Candidatus Methanoperedenaceae archaeon GB37]